MSVLGEVFTNVFLNWGFTDIVAFIMVVIGAAIGGTALVYKTINFIKSNLGNHEYSNATKADLIENEENILEHIARIIKKIERVESKIDALSLREIELRQMITPLDKDLQRLTKDNDTRYLEINRNVQDLQKVLASLHGTLLGLGDDRQGLK